MSAFTAFDVFFALVIGGLIGALGVATTNARLRSRDAALLGTVRSALGMIYDAALFAGIALPVAAMWLLGGMRAAPAALDAIVIIAMIGIGLIAFLTLLGNLLDQLAIRKAASSEPT